MKQKLSIIGLVLALALTTMGASCDKYAKAGQLAKDAAAGVLLAQQTEMALHAAGKIDEPTHIAIEGKFGDLADAGMALDKAINVQHNATGATAALSAALASIQVLSTQSILGIKDQATQVEVKAVLLSVEITLNNIAAFAGVTPTVTTTPTVPVTTPPPASAVLFNPSASWFLLTN